MFRKTDPRDQMIAYLMQQNADLMDRLQETIGQVHYHQALAAHKKLDADLAKPADVPWHVSEAEEDAIEMATNDDGSINQIELERLMSELNFENTEIEFH